MLALTYLLSRLIKKARLSAIDSSQIDPTSVIESGSTVVNSTIARYSYCGYDCTLINATIGSFCSIASRVSIGGIRHPTEFVSTSPVFLSHRDSLKKKFARHTYLPKLVSVIGHDVWIGEGAFIKAGVHVGSGSVIGMGSVVTHDVAPYAIVAGNPARLIRMRFDAAVLSKLLALEWWNWSDAKLETAGHLFADPNALLREMGDS